MATQEHKPFQMTEIDTIVARLAQARACVAAVQCSLDDRIVGDFTGLTDRVLVELCDGTTTLLSQARAATEELLAKWLAERDGARK